MRFHPVYRCACSLATFVRKSATYWRTKVTPRFARRVRLPFQSPKRWLRGPSAVSWLSGPPSDSRANWERADGAKAATPSHEKSRLEEQRLRTRRVSTVQDHRGQASPEPLVDLHLRKL